MYLSIYVAADEGGEPTATSTRGRSKVSKADEPEDFEADDELREGKLRFRGGRGEAATYDGPDDEDAAAAAAAERQARQRDGDDDDDQDDQDAEVGQGGRQGVGGTHGVAVSSRGRGGKAGPSGKGGADNTPLAAGIDEQHYRCEVTVVLPLSAPKLLMLELVERVAAATIVRCIPGVERVFVLDGERGGPPKLQTEGINFEGAWSQADLVDVDKITTNDVHAVLTAYGVEAARATILREVQVRL